AQLNCVVANNWVVESDQLNGQNVIRLDRVDGIPLIEADLVDRLKPWRHDSKKLASTLVKLLQ
ncbi:MAG: hypothetical protein ACI85U_000310, partial [Candidatus Promineifilaceae bacterium]